MLVIWLLLWAMLTLYYSPYLGGSGAWCPGLPVRYTCALGPSQGAVASADSCICLTIGKSVCSH
jgi:hypothetical protein